MTDADRYEIPCRTQGCPEEAGITGYCGTCAQRLSDEGQSHLDEAESRAEREESA